MHIRQYIYIYIYAIYIRFICIFVSAADSPTPRVQNFDNSEPGGFPRGTYVRLHYLGCTTKIALYRMQHIDCTS